MKVSEKVKKILSFYESDSPGTKTNIARILMHGKLAGTGKMVILPVGFTIYPGSDAAFDMIEEIKELAEEAKSYGLAVVVWSYPRGGDLSKIGETAIDICAYGAHMAALIGAHIIKVKPPTQALENLEAIKVYERFNIPVATLKERIEHIMQATFNGRRIVVFSGGAAKNDEDIFSEIRQIHQGGANGSIIGRNTFQRPRKEALEMLDKIIKIYQE